MAKVAFIGLGVMGYPIAGHIKSKGHEVVVYNRTTSKAKQWVEQYGGKMAGTPAKAALRCDFILTCVGDDDDLTEVSFGENGFFATASSGAVHIDHTTASADIAVRLYDKAKQSGFDSLDAPVSGGQAGAENGSLSVMLGGEEKIFAKAKPIIDCYATNVRRIGRSGSGQLTKMVNQICIAGLLQSLSEALHFAMRSGLDTEAVLDVIGGGAASSWQLKNRGHGMVKGEFDFGFAIDLMRKDLSICLAQARRNGARLPVTALVDQFYAAIQQKGGNRLDTSSLICMLEDFDKQ